MPLPGSGGAAKDPEAVEKAESKAIRVIPPCTEEMQYRPY